MDTPKHTKIKDYIPQADGSVSVVTESYHEELNHRKTEVLKNIKTNKDKFLSDLIGAIDVVTNQKTREITLTIKTDERFLPCMITKIYTVREEHFRIKKR